MVLSTVGAAYGTAKAGIGIAGLGTFRSVDSVLVQNGS
jgi:V-type H+-transporting ATPase proteolipid subunit